MALCSLLISVSDNPGAMSHFIRLSLLSPLILASENLYLPLTEASENEWPRLYAQLTLLQARFFIFYKSVVDQLACQDRKKPFEVTIIENTRTNVHQ